MKDKPKTSTTSSMGPIEFIALMAALMSLMALSIDSMLPALTMIGVDLDIQNKNNIQLVVSFIFIGIALGQLLFGPLADSLGRKPSLYIGAGFFFLGSLITIFASSFTFLLIGRVIQGIGLGGPRTITVAIIRDKFSGVHMARIMSNCLSILMIVPMIAPMLGQVVISMGGTWREIFAAVFIFGVVTTIWFYIRQEETLTPEKRVPFSFYSYLSSIASMCKEPILVLYSIAAGFIFGGMIAYVSASSQIFLTLYDTGEYFVWVFAAIALGLSVASNLNGRYVEHFGMAPICYAACLLIILPSIIFGLYIFVSGENPPLILTIIYLFTVIFAKGGLFGNLNSLAMEFMDEGAGTASTVSGVLSTIIAVPVAIIMARSINESIAPMVLGMLFCAVLTLGLMLYVEVIVKKKGDYLN